MPETPLTFSRFGGLRLDLPFDEVGGEESIDCLDVDWDESVGKLRNRDGTAKLSTEGASPWRGIWTHNSEQFLAASENNKIYALNVSNGSTIASVELTATTKVSAARFGTPSSSRTYIDAEGSEILYWNGSEFTKPKATVDGEKEKAMPLGSGLLAAWPEGGNRLVIAGPGTGPKALSSSTSHVWFSEPGNAEAYESTAFVQLLPGDGEKIEACVYWGGQIFVFKKTHMFVFTGVSVDEEGKPEFNFRSYELPAPLTPRALSTAQTSAVASPDGVYVLTRDGVYVTTGGVLSPLSSDLAPLNSPSSLLGPANETLGSSVRWAKAKGIYYCSPRLYVLTEATSGAACLVYNARIDAWVPWSAQIKSMTEVFTSGGVSTIYFTTTKSEKTKFIYKVESGATTDETATELSPRWRSGFYDLESADEKSLVLAKMGGKGTVSLKVASDYGALGSATSFAMGSSTSIVQHNKSQTGTLFSHQLSGSGAWSVQRLSRYQRENRVPGSKSR